MINQNYLQYRIARIALTPFHFTCTTVLSAQLSDEYDLTVADIHQQFALSLHQKGDYEGAIDNYIR